MFSEEHNNAFVLDIPVVDLYTKNGIIISVKDWDRGIGGNDEIGSVQIDPDTVYDFGEGSKEFVLDPPKGKSDAAGFVTLRCSQISAAERDERKRGGFFSKLGKKANLARGDVSEISYQKVHCTVGVGANRNGTDFVCSLMHQTLTCWSKLFHVKIY